MEITEAIIGSKLKKISKEENSIILEFSNVRKKKKYVVNLKGLLFETSHSAINETVEAAAITRVLGFRAVTELRRKGRGPNSYKQLYIKMRSSNDDVKIELICAYNDIELQSYNIG